MPSPFPFPFPIESGDTSGGGSSPHTSGPASGHSGVGGHGIGLGSSVGGQTSIPSAFRGHMGSVSLSGGSGPGGPGIGIGVVIFGPGGGLVSLSSIKMLN
ncbi:MAG: hypothetical protein WAM27_03185 [Nitrososphaeraceae archaeon]